MVAPWLAVVGVSGNGAQPEGARPPGDSTMPGQALRGILNTADPGSQAGWDIPRARWRSMRVSRAPR
ncbi:hypothetical protein ASD88_02070 [Pelomonas sp. Root662]|nr:hypothetical protein ASC81_02070 [Pelomonas sp. Root405]KRA77684.1 hypothetical protein ASD88_02070 [Pelomonas sp. Root662]